MIQHLTEIVEEARKRGKKRLAVAYGQDSHTLAAVYEAYKALLLENGWVLDPAYDEGRGFYCHERVGGGYYHISFNNTSKYIYFKVFQPTIDFNEWYHGYFDETIGSWFNYTTTVETSSRAK